MKFGMFLLPSCNSSSPSAFPAISLEFTILGEIMMGLFINPNIQGVTFCLRGLCIPGVFLLPPFTCLGHECQDLLRPCNGLHV